MSRDAPGASPPPTDLDAYDGRWVVLRDGIVIDHDADSEALRARVKPRPDDTLVRIGDPPGGYYVAG